MYNRLFPYLYLNLKEKSFLRTLSAIARSASSHSYLINKNQFLKYKNGFGQRSNVGYSFKRLSTSTSKPPPTSKPPGSTSSHIDDSFLPSDSEDESENTYDEDAEEERVEDVKEKIFAASLPFVNQYGWSKESLAKGAEESGLSGMSHALMRHSGYDLVSYHYKQSNQQLVEYMKQKPTNKTSTRAFLEDCVRHRLSLNLPFLSVWPQAMVLMTQPLNLPDAIRNNAQLIDHMWFYAGDTSLDHNWYTKRLILAAVYKSTEVYMIGREKNRDGRDIDAEVSVGNQDGSHGNQDGSHDNQDGVNGYHGYQDTWDFLSRRMDHVDLVGSCIATASKAPEVMASLMQVARNVHSFNNLNRKY